MDGDLTLISRSTFLNFLEYWQLRFWESRRAHIVFFCIGFLFWAAVLCPVIHNNDSTHIVHPLGHSVICKWFKDVPLLKTDISTHSPVIITFVCGFLFLNFFKATHWKTLHLSQKRILFNLNRHKRAPPL